VTVSNSVQMLECLGFAATYTSASVLMEPKLWQAVYRLSAGTQSNFIRRNVGVHAQVVCGRADPVCAVHTIHLQVSWHMPQHARKP
jgi:hypothetical protein